MIDTAVILAAGRGSRLKEVTAKRSKAMVPIAGKPIIERVMDELRLAGISKFVIVGAPHDTELASFCAATPSTMFLIQPEPKGSADALRQVEGMSPDRFVVCACDSIVPADELKRLVAQDSPSSRVTLGIIEVPSTESLSTRSVVAMSGDVVEAIVEKPKPEERVSNFSSLPLYIVRREIFTEVRDLKPSERGEYELPQAFQAIIASGGEIRGVMIRERFDLTDQRDLVTLNERYLTMQSPSVVVRSAFVPDSACLEGPLLIEDGVSIGEHVHLGPLVYIEKGASIADGIRLERVVVLRNARVRESASGVVLV